MFKRLICKLFRKHDYQLTGTKWHTVYGHRWKATIYTCSKCGHYKKIIK